MSDTIDRRLVCAENNPVQPDQFSRKLNSLIAGVIMHFLRRRYWLRFVKITRRRFCDARPSQQKE